MLLLDGLMSAKDFGQAVNGLAREFRDWHGLPKIHQLGLVVPDVEDVARVLEARGLGPFFIADGSPVLWRERGQERSFRGKMGLACYRSFELELLEPGEGSDFYRQSLDPEGRVLVQHLGFLVQGVDGWADKLAAAGVSVWVRGQLKMGSVTTDFAYMDTLAETGLVVEFIHWRILGWTFKPPASVLQCMGRLERWSGKRSLSL